MQSKFDKMNERRLGGTMAEKKLATPPQLGTEAKRSAELERAREKLAFTLEAYIGLLLEKVLPENRTEKDKENQSTVLKLAPQLAGELNLRNSGEGTNALLTTCLNSILVLRDQMNLLRYQNAYLNKQVEELKAKSVEPKDV